MKINTVSLFGMLALLSCLASCVSYQRIHVGSGSRTSTVKEQLATIAPGHGYKLFLSNGCYVKMRPTVVKPHAILGTGRLLRDGILLQKVDSVMMDSVTSVRKRKFSVVKTVGAVVGVGVLGIAVAASRMRHSGLQ